MFPMRGKSHRHSDENQGQDLQNIKYHLVLPGESAR